MTAISSSNVFSPARLNLFISIYYIIIMTRLQNRLLLDLDVDGLVVVLVGVTTLHLHLQILQLLVSSLAPSSQVQDLIFPSNGLSHPFLSKTGQK